MAAATVALTVNAVSSRAPRFRPITSACSAPVSPQTLAKYAPTTRCAESDITGGNTAPEFGAQYTNYTTIDLSGRRLSGSFTVWVVVGGDLTRKFAEYKQFVSRLMSTRPGEASNRTRRYFGVGSEALITYSVEEHSVDQIVTFTQGDAALVTRWGNAAIEIFYTGEYDTSDYDDSKIRSTPVSQQDAEAAVVAAARDIYAALR